MPRVASTTQTDLSSSQALLAGCPLAKIRQGEIFVQQRNGFLLIELIVPDTSAFFFSTQEVKSQITKPISEPSVMT